MLEEVEPRLSWAYCRDGGDGFATFKLYTSRTAHVQQVFHIQSLSLEVSPVNTSPIIACSVAELEARVILEHHCEPLDV